MKHRSRVEREEREQVEKDAIDKATSSDRERIAELEGKLRDESEEADREAVAEEIKDLQQAISKRDARLAEMAKNMKWNVDNLCHVVSERTMIGKDKDTLTTSELPPDLAQAQATRKATKAAAEVSGAAKGKAVAGPVTERSAVESYSEFVERHEALLEEYSNMESLEATQGILHKHGDILLQENATSYLLLSCLEEEMNGFKAKMRLVARQSQILSHICELAVSLRRPARDVVVPFFKRISEPEHKAAFLDAVETFITRIQKRAVDKRAEMAEAAARKKELGLADDEEQVELSREERLGPGGLDPVDVFESLPEVLQTAFQSQDTEKLKAALAAMPAEEARMHMKRCEDSGLWVPEK
jgi:cell division cycle protein 37